MGKSRSGRGPRRVLTPSLDRHIRGRIRVFAAVVAVVCFGGLLVRLFVLQILDPDNYADRAAGQQLRDTTLPAARGEIISADGVVLATSKTCWTIRASPRELDDAIVEPAARALSEILELDYDATLEKLSQRSSNDCLLRRRVDADMANAVRTWCAENGARGIQVLQDTKRVYPEGDFMGCLLGFTDVDNQGLWGLELAYDEPLTGQNGVILTAKNAWGYDMPTHYSTLQEAVPGSSLTLTIRDDIQHYLESALCAAVEEHNVASRAVGIVMDVNTGAVLAMASLPTYDLNSPGTVYNDFLTSGMTEEQVLENMSDLLNKQWRSKAINDTYEPGSTFKTMTLAMALEENVVDLNTGFYCSGSVKIEGETINCSKRAPGHGQQNLTQAFANSCNPAFINIGLRIGNDKFYQYMLDFGLTEKTGIDTTGEASGFVNSEIKYSTLALACYAFGQNFNVTPIALLAAQCACVNGGYLYTPYLVEEITDQDGNVVSKHDSTPIRQVVSEETSALVRDIMEYEVTTGTGKNGQVAGYRIGGKTGTADKVGGGVIVSFVCFAPADDPQVMMLLTLDEPSKWTGTYVSGGNMVAPVASSVMGEILPYLGIEPSYTAEELVGADKTVPNVVDLSKDAAAERLSANGFSFRTVGSGDTVTDQTPAGGAIVPNSAEIILYLGAEKSTDKCIVPNVVGDSAATANQKIVNAGLIMGVSGATNASSSTVRAISQSIAAGTEVEAGTVVRVQFSDSSVRD